jgi:protein O-GlcNAc transferase
VNNPSPTAPISEVARQAIAHHQAGRLGEAAALYRQILEVEPHHPDALHLLGVLAMQVGDNEGAAGLIAGAIRAHPSHPVYHFNLGVALQAQGKTDTAIEHYRQAVLLAPNYAEAHNNLALALQSLGKLDMAIEHYRLALALQPGYANVHSNMGVALFDRGELGAAVERFRNALALQPDYAEAHYNLGRALKDLGQLDAAIASQRKALALKPDYAEAHGDLSAALQAQGKLDEAREHHCKMLLLKPDSAEAHFNLGVILKKLDRQDESELSYRRALQIQPDFAEAHYNLGVSLMELGRREEAATSLRQALASQPEFAEARWVLAMIQIPLVADTPGEIEACRKNLLRELVGLNTWFDVGRTAGGYRAVGTYQPFYLAYQEQNNRDILFQYGTLCVRLMQHWHDRQAFPSPRTALAGAIRVGIVSAHVHNHSVWNAIVKGWLQHLDRARFELHVFHLGDKQDEETIWSKSVSTSFAQGKQNIKQWVEAILEKRADVLIYPEIGMNSMTVKLASLRLAPIQIAAWGHPETTGLPSMDYYLSAEHFEPEDAQNNYTERLIRLPNLGCHYHPAQITGTAPDCASLGIDPLAPLFLCPGTPFKYAPQHDHVLVDIAQQLGKCQFVFFTFRKRHLLSEKFYRRLEAAFAAADLNFDDYCKFIPWQKKSAFYGLMERADALLDTIGFSGFNTAMQAVECGLPIVTREGRFMRGRLAGGILRRMGVTELIAATEDEYVNLAVRLARDAAYRQSVRQRIASSRPILFDDIAPVRALEDFLHNVVKRN